MDTSITAGQQKQIGRFVEDEIGKANLTKEQAQRFISRGDEWLPEFGKLVKKFSDYRYADEVVASNFFYPLEYTVRPIDDQINNLVQIFGLDGAKAEKAYKYAKSIGPCPVDWTDGLFAVLSPRALFPEIVNPRIQYGESLEVLFFKIKDQRGGFFINWIKGKVGFSSSHIRMLDSTYGAVQKLMKIQDNSDILVVDAQTGGKYRGSSPRRSREMLGLGEYGLPVLFAGSILLNHPNRLNNFIYWNVLGFHCIGDEFVFYSDELSVYTPSFYFSDSSDSLVFNTCLDADPYIDMGSASFLLRSK